MMSTFLQVDEEGVATIFLVVTSKGGLLLGKAVKTVFSKSYPNMKPPHGLRVTSGIALQSEIERSRGDA